MTFAPRTWVVGETVTAALMNQEIRDQFNELFAAWTDFTPTWGADSGTTTVGNGSLAGRYLQAGRLVFFNIRFEWGSTTTQSVSGSSWNFALPVTAFSDGVSTWHVVNCWIFDTSESARFHADAYINSLGTTIVAITANADGGFLDDAEMPSQTAAGGSTTSVQPGSNNWADGDRINIWGFYEAANL